MIKDAETIVSIIELVYIEHTTVNTLIKNVGKAYSELKDFFFVVPY